MSELSDIEQVREQVEEESSEDGQFEDVWGAEVIRVCLEYYLEREWYDRCAVLRDLQTAFREKHGDFVPKCNLQF